MYGQFSLDKTLTLQAGRTVSVINLPSLTDVHIALPVLQAVFQLGLLYLFFSPLFLQGFSVFLGLLHFTLTSLLFRTTCLGKEIQVSLHTGKILCCVKMFQNPNRNEFGAVPFKLFTLLSSSLLAGRVRTNRKLFTFFAKPLKMKFVRKKF